MDYFSTFCKYQIFAGNSPKSLGSASPSAQPSKNKGIINIHPSLLVRNRPVDKNGIAIVQATRRKRCKI